MFSIYYSTPATEDLLSILEYISNKLKSPSVAENLLNQIEEQSKILEENPFIFPLVKDEYLNKLSIRHIAVKNYFLCILPGAERRPNIWITCNA